MIPQIIYYAIVVLAVLFGITALMVKERSVGWSEVFEMYRTIVLFILCAGGGLFFFLYVLPKILGLPTLTIRT